jgi:hypothetical protein
MLALTDSGPNGIYSCTEWLRPMAADDGPADEPWLAARVTGADAIHVRPWGPEDQPSPETGWWRPDAVHGGLSVSWLRQDLSDANPRQTPLEAQDKHEHLETLRERFLYD